MKKILFLFQLPPPIHGASVVNKSIQDSYFINSSVEAHYVNISPAKSLDDIGKAGPVKFLLTFIIFVRALTAYIKIRPSLVYMTLSPHGKAFYKDGLLAILLKFFGANLVFHMHGKGVAKAAARSKIINKFYCSVFKDVDVIHLSQSLFFDLDGIRDQTKSIVAIPNGVEPVEYSREKVCSDKITFIYLSNIVRSKGVDVLLKALSIIPSSLQEGIQVKIVGRYSDKVYFSEVEKLIEENPYDNVYYLGPKYGKEKIFELSTSDVFVLPTKNDCFPLSILESMSVGLSIIATNEGAIPDIVESGITGITLDDCTPEKLAAAMVKYIENPEYMKACGKAGKEKYKTHYTQQVFEENLTSTLKAFAGRA